jgi:hypothetical protein
MVVVNLPNYATILRLTESTIGLRALTPINKIGMWYANIDILSRWASPS